jgi:hypothetical protein
MANGADRLEQGFRLCDGTTGGYASELWEVRGASPLEVLGDAGIALGLPKPLQEHPASPKLLVRERSVALIIDNKTCWVQVDYRPATFDLATVLSSRSRSLDALDLRLIWTRSTQAGNNGWILRGGEGDTQSVIKLWRSTRVFTVIAGADQDALDVLIESNKGKAYTFGTRPNDRKYILFDAATSKDRSGRVTAEYVFMTHNGFPSIPSGTYQGQDLAIPACPPLGMVFTSQTGTNQPEFLVKQPISLYLIGTPLPGLPQ